MKRLSAKFEILIFLGLIITLLFFIFNPLAVTRANSIEFNTLVYKVGEGSEGNVILKLDNGTGIYYINHGLQKGLDLDTLKKQLINHKVTVFYLKNSFVSGFSPVASTKYITELRLGEKVIYSEL
ncbi:MAG: hypothetical protein V4721_06970 [Bacteroidota bacterium]